jgi:hypothetical protein
MASIIRPLSSIDPQPIKEYLVSFGIPEAVVDWKYFDQSFNRGQERGFVSLSEGRVRGFIGLIPFRIVHNRREFSVAWSCDWSLDRRAQTGLAGLMLVRECLRPYDFVLSSGGNEKTRRIFSQIAPISIPGAGITLHAPIRVGCFLHVLQEKLGDQITSSLDRLRQVPLRRGRTALSSDRVTIEPGLSAVLHPLLEKSNIVDGCPLYDFEYLHWQIGRCPVLDSYTVYLKGKGDVRTAVLLWCSATSRDFWRMAVLSMDPNPADLDSLVAMSLSFVQSEGGVALSVGASRHETKFIAVMRAHGFIVSPRRRPLYILGGSRGASLIPEPRQLGFLDTDWAYRVPVRYSSMVSAANSSEAPSGGLSEPADSTY